MRARVLSIITGIAALGGAPMSGAMAQPQPVVPAASESTAALRTRLDPRTRVLVEHIIDSAHVTGVPVEPLVDKALEGASKRASPEAIVRAVRGLALDLTTARQALGPQSYADELTAGAAALRAGVDTEALRHLRHDRPGQPLVIALSVLTDLIAGGVPADNATRSVLALTSKGVADEQLVAFRRDVERDIAVGAPPGIATVVRLNGPYAQVNTLDGAQNRSAPRKPRP